MINEYGVDIDYFWRKVLAWAKEEAVLRGREVPYREILCWRFDYCCPTAARRK